jgi:hypothetical protein
MPRSKGLQSKNIQKKETPKKTCPKCNRNLAIDTNFYKSSSPMFDGRAHICRKCILGLVDYSNMQSIYDILQQLDIKFDYTYWQRAVESSKETMAIYITMANSLPQFEGTGWKHSIFETSTNNNTDFQKKNTVIEEDVQTQKPSNDTGLSLDMLKEKYGFGYPDEEYILFERKYQQLRPSFQLVTTMHEEYFREFCVNKVKETLAKAKGHFKEAKEWAAMVKDVAEAGKLKPSQMSKADLSGGLDTFGQLVRMVEENYEIMPLLPQFTEKPKDKVDVTLWCFINYVRDLKGLPECEYKEIYDFYRRKKEDYEKQMSDGVLQEGEDDISL